MTKVEALVASAGSTAPETSAGAEKALPQGEHTEENRTADPLAVLSSAEFKKHRMHTHQMSS